MILILNLKTLFATGILMFMSGIKFLYLHQVTKKTSYKIISIQFLLISSDFAFLSVCVIFIETDLQKFFVFLTLVKMAFEFSTLFVMLILTEFNRFREK